MSRLTPTVLLIELTKSYYVLLVYNLSFPSKKTSFSIGKFVRLCILLSCEKLLALILGDSADYEFSKILLKSKNDQLLLICLIRKSKLFGADELRDSD